MKGGRLARAAALALGLMVPAAALAGHNTTAITAFNGAGKCTDCHGVGTIQLNGAGTDATVLNHVFDETRPAGEFMDCAYANFTISLANKNAIANWLKDIVDGTEDDAVYPSRLFTISNTFVAANAQKTDINTGALQHITAGGYAFSHIQTTSITPGAGTITWSGSTGTYTPPGYPSSTFVGDVSFTYQGRDTRNGKNIFGHLYSGTIRVGAAPSINSSLSPAGTVGTPLSFTVTSTNFPSFS